MKRPVAGLLTLALLSSWLRAGDVAACGGSIEGPVYVNARNPDLPLARFASGHIGVAASWDQGFRAMTYRMLADAPLDEAERAALVQVYRQAHRANDPLAIEPTLPAEATTGDPSGEYVPDESAWQDARQAALGSRGSQIANGWSTDGAWTPNCLDDAFRAAAVALRERVAHYGANSDAVREWVEAQDAVFSNCGPTPGRTPPALRVSDSEEQRRDRDYQVAASDFYAGRYEAAERGFTAIAADTASPWSTMARYLVLRTITRAAQRGRATPDAARLARAATAAATLLADPQGAAVHDMTRHYSGWIDVLRDPGARLHSLGVDLARAGRDADFGGDLHDYMVLYDSSAVSAVRGTPVEADPLTAWVSANEDRDALIARYNRERGRPWLIAALRSAGDAHDRRLDPLIAAARAVPRADIGFATAQYEQLRLRLARGERVHEEIVRASHDLNDGDGPTTLNLFRELALRAATDVDHFTSVSYGRPAGYLSEGALVVPVTPAADGTVAPDFSPLGASVLSSRVPLAVLLRVAANPTLPLPLRERVTSVALHRAAILGDETAFLAASALVPRMSETAARPLRALAQAATADARRFELLNSLLVGGGSWAIATSMVDEQETRDPWEPRCGGAPTTLEPAWFLTAAQRTALTRERAQWAAMNDGRTWLASEAARLAPLMVAEPRMPALLAAALRNTRYNECDPRSPVHRASRAAFQALHQWFPRSAEATAARYWY